MRNIINKKYITWTLTHLIEERNDWNTIVTVGESLIKAFNGEVDLDKMVNSYKKALVILNLKIASFTKLYFAIDGNVTDEELEAFLVNNNLLSKEIEKLID